MNQPIKTNKDRAFGLYTLAYQRIKECLQTNNSEEIIPFPSLFEKLCRSFSITKKEAWELLYILRDFEKIEVVPFHGVIVKNGK